MTIVGIGLAVVTEANTLKGVLDIVTNKKREKKRGEGVNISAKCNCCACEAVCKYKTMYQNGVETILNTTIDDYKGGFFKLRDCPHIEVSIKCPHMITKSQGVRGIKE